MRDKSRRIIWAYTIALVGFYIGMGFIIPQFALFYQRMGYSLADLGFTQAIFQASLLTVSIFFLRNKRRIRLDLLFKAGLTLFTISTGIYALSSKLILFLIAETICGIGIAFTNVGCDAWLVTALQNEGEIELGQKTIANTSALGKMLSLPSILAGGFLGSINAHLPFYLCLFFCLLSSLMAWIFIKPIAVKTRSQITNNTKSDLPPLRVLLVVVCVILVLTATQSGFGPSWPILFSSFLGEKWVGALGVSVNIFLALGGFLAARISARPLTFALLLCLAGLGLGIGGSNGLIGLGAFLLSEILFGAIAPLIASYRNMAVSEGQRPRVNAIGSIVQGLSGMVGAFFFGRLNVYSLLLSWRIMGILLVMGGLVIFIVNKLGKEG